MGLVVSGHASVAMPHRIRGRLEVGKLRFGERNQNHDLARPIRGRACSPATAEKTMWMSRRLEGPDSVSAGLLLGGVASEVGLWPVEVDGLGGTQASRASTNHPDDRGLGTP